MTTTQPFPIYVGWDSREDIAYQVCRSSLLRHASGPIDVTPLKQEDLCKRGLYRRERDPLASTEFTYTRFLVPALTGYQGWALFCDCDFLWTADVTQLMASVDDRYAVMCVHHDHNPPETVKMDGAIQTRYPRKNWSSMVLYHCGHPANAGLTPELVSTETGALPASLSVARRRSDRRRAGNLELAGRVEPKAGSRHAQRHPLHPRRPLVRKLAGCRLWRPMGRGRTCLSAVAPHTRAVPVTLLRLTV